MITTRRTRKTTLVALGDPFPGSKILLTRRNKTVNDYSTKEILRIDRVRIELASGRRTEAN